MANFLYMFIELRVTCGLSESLSVLYSFGNYQIPFNTFSVAERECIYVHITVENNTYKFGTNL